MAALLHREHRKRARRARFAGDGNMNAKDPSWLTL